MLNFNHFLKQAQGMQKKMQEIQNDMSSKQYIGKSGGGIVTITIDGNKNMLSISIDSSLLKSDDKEILEDLIVAAFNDAKQKADKDSQELISNTLIGMGLPPDLKLTF